MTIRNWPVSLPAGRQAEGFPHFYRSASLRLGQSIPNTLLSPRLAERIKGQETRLEYIIDMGSGIQKNSEITAKEMRVIGASGENLGVMQREDALKLVRPEEGLDLVLISPLANPPVARVMSFDKFRYQQEKAKKKERQGQNVAGPKQIQISAREAAHDLETKIRKLEEFFAEGRQVEIQLRLRGREKGNKPWAEQKLNEFMAMIPSKYKVLSPPKFGGRGIGVYIIKA